VRRLAGAAYTAGPSLNLMGRTKAMMTARYNLRDPMKHARWLTMRLSVCLWLVFAGAAWGQAADSWTAPATELARQIAALTGPGAISLNVRNNSSIAASDVPVIRQGLQVALGALGVTIRNQMAADATTTVQVTLSQTAQQGLWVAEVQQGPETRVAMVTAANPAPAAEVEGTPVLLRRALLFSQSSPMLDVGLFALPGDAAGEGHLVVLSPELIAIYHRDEKADGGWVKDQSFEIAHGRAYPRDVRGRLQADAGAVFKAYLPGVICTVSQRTTGVGVAVSCGDSDDPWPIGSRKAFYNSSRNFFTGVITPSVGVAPGPFYSAADLLQKNGMATVYSEVSGQVRLYDGGGLRVLAGSRDWGSDVAGVRSECGSGAQLLATASGVATQDSLRAYEVQGRNAIAVSAPLPMDGEVTAMWPMTLANGSAAAPAVVAILKRQQPVRYEAYRVSEVCNQ
jgi:hypothetical protein